MKISLVLATLGKTPLVTRFLRALAAQAHEDFELVVVDQGSTDLLKGALAPFEGQFPTLHLAYPPGLSRARNVGLRQIRGEVVAFPDDDCWYPTHLLAKVDALFRAHPHWDGIVGRLVWEEGQPERPKAKRPVEVNLYNAVTSLDSASLYGALVRKRPVAVSSTTLFLRSNVVQQIGGFDEQLGLGAGTIFGGGEDLELLVRCLKAGFRVHHDSTLKVYHPHPKKGYADPQRGFGYGAGLGRVLRKHRYPTWFVLYHLSRTLWALGVAFLRGRKVQARYHAAVLKGKLAGWKDYNIAYKG